jgi:hypothetical protein
MEDLESLWASSQPPSEPMKANTTDTSDNLESLWTSAEQKPVEFSAEMLKGASNVSEMPEISGQTVGGIGLPLAAAATGVGTIPALGYALLGGAGGEAWEQVYEQFAEPEKAPETGMEAAEKILKAGGEEVLYEAGGRTVGYVAGKAYHIARPKIKAGVEELQNTLQRYGGNLTSAERTDSFLTQTIDSLVRGSLSAKGIMKNADDINDAALKLWQSDLSNKIASSAAKNMTDEEFGLLIKSTIGDGKAAFKNKMGELYSSFDDLVVTRLEKDMVDLSKKPVLDAAGKVINPDIISGVSKEIRPVDLRPLKNQANLIAEKLGRIKNIGIGEFGGKTLKDILSLDDAARFSDAHMLRSSLLDIQRGLKNEPTEAKLYGSITNFVSELSKSMDNAAMKQGDDAFLAYKRIQKEAKKGYKVFNDDVVAAILKDKNSAVKVGEMIYKDGNVDQVRSLKRALTRAAKYDKSIDSKGIWEQTQQKYLESVFNSIAKDIGTEAGETLTQFQARSGAVSAEKLLKRLQNPKQVNTMNEVFAPEHRQLIFDFARAAEITQGKNVAGLSMLMQLTQGGATVGALTGRPGAAQMAATILLPTTILAKLMTNPLTVRLMTSAAKTPLAAKEAPKIATKLMIAIENAKAEEEGRDKPVDVLTQPFTDKLQAL